MIGQYHPASLEPPEDPKEAAYERCAESDQLEQRAIDWAATHAWQHADLVETIVDHYLQSPEFDLWVDDVHEGEDTA